MSKSNFLSLLASAAFLASASARNSLVRLFTVFAILAYPCRFSSASFALCCALPYTSKTALIASIATNIGEFATRAAFAIFPAAASAVKPFLSPVTATCIDDMPLLIATKLALSRNFVFIFSPVCILVIFTRTSSSSSRLPILVMLSQLLRRAVAPLTAPFNAHSFCLPMLLSITSMESFKLAILPCNVSACIACML